MRITRRYSLLDDVTLKLLANRRLEGGVGEYNSVAGDETFTKFPAEELEVE